MHLTHRHTRHTLAQSGPLQCLDRVFVLSCLCQEAEWHLSAAVPPVSLFSFPNAKRSKRSERCVRSQLWTPPSFSVLFLFYWMSYISSAFSSFVVSFKSLLLFLFTPTYCSFIDTLLSNFLIYLQSNIPPSLLPATAPPFSHLCWCTFLTIFMADLLYITLPKRISFFWTRDVNLSKVSPRICLYFSLSGLIALEELLCDMNR